MRVIQAAESALWARMGEGPFRKAELEAIAVAAGQPKPRAYSAVSSFINDLKAKGAVYHEGAPRSGHWVLLPRDQWTGAPIPAATPKPELKAPAVVGPYDPAPEIEGPNNGLTEAFAEHLWHDLGAGDAGYSLKSRPVMEQRGWRDASERALKFLFDLGMVGPAGKPRAPFTGWSYKWLYEASTWEIADEEGGYVAMVGNDGDVPLFLAAPDMAFAIKEALERFDRAGGIKRTDIDALRSALPVAWGPLLMESRA